MLFIVIMVILLVGLLVGTQKDWFAGGLWFVLFAMLLCLGVGIGIIGTMPDYRQNPQSVSPAKITAIGDVVDCSSGDIYKNNGKQNDITYRAGITSPVIEHYGWEFTSWMIWAPSSRAIVPLPDCK